MIKIAFIGAGYMTEEHIRAFKSFPEVNVVGIYSRTKTKAENLAKKYGIEFVANSIDHLYNEKSPNGVIVSVPELSTKEVCLESFKYPWSLMIEKPIGYNFLEAKFLCEEALKNNSKVYVAFNRRYYTSTQKVLNDIKEFQGNRIVSVLDQEDLISAKLGGQPDKVLENWMYANSIHIIDYFRIFLRGEIESVDPIFKWEPGSPNFVASKISSSVGDVGIYQCQWNAPGPWSVSVTTQKRRWEMRPLEQVIVQDFGSRKVETYERGQLDIDFKPGLKLQAEEFLKAIKNQRSSLENIQGSLKTMELVKRIYDL